MSAETMVQNQPQEFKRSQTRRLSEQYPPTSTNNSKYIADIHEVLQNIDHSIVDLSSSISIREIMPEEGDLDQLKILYKEWFPVDYDEKFWDKVMRQEFEGYVAELDLSAFNEKKYIVGAIIFYEKQALQQDLGLCIELFFNKLYSIYVQTIGVINELRNYKIGTKLLDKVKEIAQRRRYVKYISLHMVEYNQSGEKFYTKNGFSKIRTLLNFTKLEENFYNFFYYCFYVNGGRKPTPTNYWIKIYEKIKMFFKKLIAFIMSLY